MERRSTKIAAGRGDGKHCGLILDAKEEESRVSSMYVCNARVKKNNKTVKYIFLLFIIMNA